MPTALQLDRKDWRRYAIPAARAPASLGTPSSEIRRLLKQVAIAAERIKAELGATRVMLFGSLAHGAWYGADSDVDLAVEGLAGGKYLDAWRIAEDLIPGRCIDVVELETASAPLQRAIEAEGKTL
jgi:predicted nucleotidyltransferase